MIFRVQNYYYHSEKLHPIRTLKFSLKIWKSFISKDILLEGGYKFPIPPSIVLQYIHNIFDPSLGIRRENGIYCGTTKSSKNLLRKITSVITLVKITPRLWLILKGKDIHIIKDYRALSL